ncbi:translation factor GTPase family protein [Amycolatopsis sp. H20-H5]|uniref:translation factor GTPase family protein n=1 Tax=Amycolatopsis sp. H20-H5 TaxID=3046309 RepID=UPI002DC0212C|nr:translation factor GTPase family protein [Amycolatopsis sp. H20-H5]MEC3973741.1 translation factor GTPase family protein [Amycolatopsis sp. H20-H5]
MLNLGILAHVDAGKTSLTERLLFDAGAIATMGAVDDGSTQTDAMELERARGITIRSSVATFTAGEHRIQLIDTPGHADFIAEVARALGVLDGAVLVVSAVEGVQAQTRVLMRTLTAMAMPTVVFVNKIDRPGARGADLLADIRRTLTPSAIAMNSLSGLGTPEAAAAPRPWDPAFAEELAELLSDRDDALLESYLYAPGTLDHPRLRAALAAQSRAAFVHPVFFGSAITGSGIEALRGGITEFLPSAAGADRAALDGTVFAIERDPAGAKSAMIRLFSGTLAARDTVTFSRRERTGAITAEPRKATAVVGVDGRPGRVPAGGIAKVTGLRGIRVGDRIGSTATPPTAPPFRPPTLETVVTARDPARAAALFTALGELAEQDPWIDVRRGAPGGGLTVSLYGEVQREVIAARLDAEFGVEADFSPSRVVCIEKPRGTGSAVEEFGKDGPPNLYATVGLRLEPGPPGSGTRFLLEAERGSLPPSFVTAIEETVHATLRQGLHGWQVVDCAVTLTHTGYASPISTAGDFRAVTALVCLAALKEAGTTVCEPLNHVELELPIAALKSVLLALAGCAGLPEEPVVRGGSCSVDAVIPVARQREFERRLPGLTGGSGTLTSRFEGYQEQR